MRGVLICVEGINGSGEGTHANLLVRKLGEGGYKVSSVSFPDYTTSIGKEIREFLGGQRDFSPEVRQFLYAANRWERKADLEGWLKEGRVMVANRYIPSGLAYGLANGLDLEWMMNLERGLPPADLVIVIDVPVEVHFQRTKGKDIYEVDGRFLERVRAAYLNLAKKFKWNVVNGTKPMDRIADEIWKMVSRFL